MDICQKISTSFHRPSLKQATKLKEINTVFKYHKYH